MTAGGSPRPTIPEILPVVRRYVADRPVGGNLHIWLYDFNVRDCDIEFCLKESQAKGDKVGARICEVGLQMTKTQRSRLALLAWRAE